MKATWIMVKGAMLGRYCFKRVVSVNQRFCDLERLLLHVAEGLELGGEWYRPCTRCLHSLERWDEDIGMIGSADCACALLGCIAARVTRWSR